MRVSVASRYPFPKLQVRPRRGHLPRVLLQRFSGRYVKTYLTVQFAQILSWFYSILQENSAGSNSLLFKSASCNFSLQSKSPGWDLSLHRIAFNSGESHTEQDRTALRGAVAWTGIFQGSEVLCELIGSMQAREVQITQEWVLSFWFLITWFIPQIFLYIQTKYNIFHTA